MWLQVPDQHVSQREVGQQDHQRAPGADAGKFALPLLCSADVPHHDHITQQMFAEP